jgi:hypothetical protein
MKSLSIDAGIVPIVFRLTVTAADGTVLADGTTVQTLESDMPRIVDLIADAFTQHGYPAPITVDYQPA